MANSWKRLVNSTTAAGNSTTLTISSIPASESIRLSIYLVGVSGGIDPAMYFNGENSGTKYSRRNAQNNSASQNYGTMANISLGDTTLDNKQYWTIDISNHDDRAKIIDARGVGFGASGAGTAPNFYECHARWNETDRITSISFSQTAGGTPTNFADTTTVTIFGSDDLPVFYPNIPNGAVFEESDTGKHYMWDGTSVWNELA